MLVVATVVPADDRHLARQIYQSLAGPMTQLLRACREPIRLGLEPIIHDALIHSPEYISLAHDQLRAELGVTNAERILHELVLGLSRGARVHVEPVRATFAGLSGGMEIGLVRENLQEVLGLSVASFSSEGGHVIEWLRWLLTAGDSLILTDYRFVAEVSPRSRTGLGLMLRPGTWRVPAQFAGTIHDNWLTRALSTIEQPLFELVRNVVTLQSASFI